MMKKTLMMAAVAAMAFGAQASYTWTVVIRDVDAEAAANLEKYISTLSAKLYYTGGSSYVQAATASGGSVTGQTTSGDITYYTVPLGQAFTKTSRQDGKFDYSYSMSGVSIPGDNDSGNKYAGSKDLLTELSVYSPTEEKTLVFNLKTGADTEGGQTFAAYASYQNLPEPTSGMLVLLGLAGLALKRKRAA